MKKQCLLLMTVFGLTISFSACNKVIKSSSDVSIKSSESSENSSSLKESSSSSQMSSSLSSSSSSMNSVQECINHSFKETNRSASIIEKGATVKTCEKCGYVEESNYTYDLNEFAYPIIPVYQGMICCNFVAKIRSLASQTA